MGRERDSKVVRAASPIKPSRGLSDRQNGAAGFQAIRERRRGLSGHQNGAEDVREQPPDRDRQDRGRHDPAQPTHERAVDA